MKKKMWKKGKSIKLEKKVKEKGSVVIYGEYVDINEVYEKKKKVKN
jgi:hypothetical protein